MGGNHKRPSWSADEQRRLDDAVAELGVGKWGEIAERVGTRNAGACLARYYNPHRAARWADLGAIDRKVPAYVLAEREAARAAAEQRSITAEHLGDPLPGRSALDHKLNGEASAWRFRNPYGITITMRPAAKVSLYWGKRSADEARA